MITNTSKDASKAYTLNIIETLIEMGVTNMTLWNLFKYLKKVEKNPNEYQVTLDTILKLSETDKYGNMPKVLNIIIDELSRSKNFKENAEILLREDIIYVIHQVYEFARENFRETSDIEETIKGVLSLVLCYQEKLDDILKNVKIYPGLIKLFSYNEGRKIIINLIEAEKIGLLKKDDIKDYSIRIAQIIEKTADNLYTRFGSIGKILTRILLKHISDNVGHTIYILPKNPREDLDRTLDRSLKNFNSIYSDENIRYLIKLSSKLGLSSNILTNLENIRDPLVFSVLIRLLNKDAFIIAIKSLQSYGNIEIGSVIENITDALAKDIYNREHLKDCLKSGDPSSCKIAQFFYGETLYKVPKKPIIEEAIERLVNTFANKPYFPNLLHTILTKSLEGLEPGEIRSYIRVITSSSAVKLFDLLYKRDWRWGIRYVKEYILPSVRLLINRFKEDGTKMANKLIKIMRSYASLEPKVYNNFSNILYYTNEIIENISYNRENLEKFINLLDNLLKNYIIGKRMKIEITSIILRHIYASIESYKDMERKVFDEMVSKTLDHYSKPEVIENLARRYLGSSS